MFCVIYKFEVKKGQHVQFKKAWKELTKLIYQHEGSLGSRLHQEDGETYIAYATWPSKKLWENSGNLLPPGADKVRESMKDACTEISTLSKLEMVDDLLANTIYEDN